MSSCLKLCLHITSLCPSPSELPSKFNIVSMITDTLMGKMGCTPILTIKKFNVDGTCKQAFIAFTSDLAFPPQPISLSTPSIYYKINSSLIAYSSFNFCPKIAAEFFFSVRIMFCEQIRMNECKSLFNSDVTVNLSCSDNLSNLLPLQSQATVMYNKHNVS